MSRLRRTLGLVVAFGLLTVASSAIHGCAENPANPDGGGMDGARPDGSVGPTGRCGGAAASCCTGRICELGLQCGAGDVCCIQAGGGTRCNSASDCCRGLACSGGACCAPRAAACTGSNDCCTGLVCNGGVCANDDDLPPGSEGCGGATATCCPGFTCRSGLVCTDGTCSGCGDDGQPCCDGSTACIGSLACDVTTGNCVNADPATACGEIDNECCVGTTGVPSECSGALVCTAGRCLNADDVGFEGAPCGPRGSCDPDLVCDRRMDPRGTCITTPEDCGRETMMCCDLGGTEGGECAGSMHCQFGDCSTCRGPSLSCLLGGLLPGQECCSGSVCRPSPLVPRCCMGGGGNCENSLDCCGLMTCGGDGTCSCSGEGSFCITNAECCDGFTCSTFQCRAAGPACLDPGAMCMASTQCCDGLACSETRTEPTAPPVRQCCSGGSTSCDADEDCCGRMACEDGECQCVASGGLCDRDIECCNDGGGSNICVAGACADGAGCARETRTCSDDGTTAPMCCGGLRCDLPLVTRDRRCCGGLGNRCRNDMDCCGNSTCGASETCECVAEGMPCETRLECCTGLSCAETSAGSGSFSCQRPPP